MPALSATRVTALRRSWDSTFPGFTPKKTAMRGVPKQSLKTALREGKYEDAGWRVRKDGSLVRLVPAISPWPQSIVRNGCDRVA
jgi:hypothetical protein